MARLAGFLSTISFFIVMIYFVILFFGLLHIASEVAPAGPGTKADFEQAQQMVMKE